jgi:hypothetical protein
MTLYGFADAESRDLFTILLSVSGVGPKIGLATLAVYDAQTLRQALADGDVTALTRVPGIGKRGAERMVLELRDKIGSVVTAGGTTAVGGHAIRGDGTDEDVRFGYAATLVLRFGLGALPAIIGLSMFVEDKELVRQAFGCTFEEFVENCGAATRFLCERVHEVQATLGI